MAGAAEGATIASAKTLNPMAPDIQPEILLDIKRTSPP